VRQNFGPRFSIAATTRELLGSARVESKTHRRSEWSGHPAIATASGGYPLGGFLDWSSVLDPDRRVRGDRRREFFGRSHRHVGIASIWSRGSSAIVAVLLSVSLLAGVLSVQSSTDTSARTSAAAAHSSIAQASTSSTDAARATQAALERAIRRTLGHATDSAFVAAAASFRDLYATSGAELRATGFTIGVGRAAIGRGQTLQPISSKLVIDRRGATYGAAGLVESYFPSSSGVEQSFKLATRPAGHGPLTIDVPVRGVVASGFGSTVDLSGPKGQTVAAYHGLRVVDANDQVIPASMRAISNGKAIRITVVDEHATYPLTVDPTWSQTGELTASDGAASDGPGTSVSIFGATALVGVPAHTVSGHATQGAAYIFTESGSTWSQAAELTASDGAAGDAFGTSVSLNGATALIGAPGHSVSGNAGQGDAYVFTGSGSSWSQAAELTSSDGAAGDAFGTSVSLGGTNAVIGAPSHAVSSNAGEGDAYVFTGSGSSWTQAQELTSSDGAASDAFGTSVGISGANAVIGAPDHTVSGHVGQGEAYVFNESGATWSQAQKLTSSDGAAGDAFGSAVAISGINALVGAPSHTVSSNTAEGDAYIFSESGSTWSQSIELTSSDGAASDNFGKTVALDGAMAIVGAPAHAVSSNSGQGDAYEFTESSTSWTQVAELTSSDGAASDAFGSSVALFGTMALVEAPDHTVASNSAQGAAYVFDNALSGGSFSGPQRIGGGGGAGPTDTTVANSIDVASGDYFTSATDASIATYGPPLAFTRTYDAALAQAESASSTPGPLGYGWTDNWGTSLALNSDYGTTVSGDITLTEANGVEALFTSPSGGSCTSPYVGPGTSGTYCALPRVNASLTYNSGSSTYTLLSHPYSSYTFNSSGALTSIADANGTSESVTYSSPSPGSGNCPGAAGSCELITSASGRTLTIGWSGSGDTGTITSVTDPLGREWVYAYGSNNLTSVTDPLSKVTSFTYDSSNANANLKHDLLTLTAPDGQVGGPDAGDDLSNTYNGSGQVTSETDANSDVTTLSYANINSTSLTGVVLVTLPDSSETQDLFNQGALEASTTKFGTSSASTSTYQVDPSTLLDDAMTDPSGDTTITTYGTDDNVTASTNALGNTSTSKFNSFDEATCVTQPLAANPCSSLSPPAAVSPGGTITVPSAPPAYVTYALYDTHGNALFTTSGSYSTGGSLLQTSTTYDLYNSNSVTIGGNSDSCTTSAPSTELPCATIGANAVVTQLAYNADGDLTSKSTPDGNTSSSPGVISTFAGAPMGPVAATYLDQPDWQISTVTVGGVPYAYTADVEHNNIHRINLRTDVETVVAGNTIYGYSGNSAAATGAEFAQAKGVSADSSGDFAIADTGNNVVRFVPAASGTYFGTSMTGGDIYTIAGNGTAGFSGNNGTATSAELNTPDAVALESGGVAIADTNNNEIRFVANTTGTYFGISMTAGKIYDIAGTGTAGYSGNNGAATSAKINAPNDIALDASGDLGIADTNNNVVRFVPVATTTHFGVAMTADDIYLIAGNHTAGFSGNGGAATSAKLDLPGAIAFDSAGDLAIADTWNYEVRFVPVSTASFYNISMTAEDIYDIVGDNTNGYTGNGAVATSAEVGNLIGLAVDSNGDVLASDENAGGIRIMAAATGALDDQQVTAWDLYVLAGTGSYTDANYAGPPAEVQLGGPSNIRADGSGDLAITDGDDVIRFIPSASGTYFGQSMTASDIYTIAGDGNYGYTGNGGAATSAELNSPFAAAFDKAGDLGIADSGNNVIRFVPVATGTYFGQSMTANHIYTIAGDGTAGFSGNGGAATSAEINGPTGVAFDAAGDLILTDTISCQVRFVPVASGTYFGVSMTADHIYTIAGNGTGGYSGNGGAATSAEMNYPYSVSVDAHGNLVIADTYSAAVRYVPVTSGTYYGQSMTANHIYTIAGNGTGGYSGDGGSATSAEISSNVYDVGTDAAGNLYITDSGNDVVQFVPVASGTYYDQSMTADHIYTIAGAGWGSSYFAGDGGSPMSAEFAWITSTIPDGNGGFYIADDNGYRIRHVTVESAAGPNAVTTYGYDADGEQTSMTSANGNLAGANSGNYTTTTNYNADGAVTSVVTSSGAGATAPSETTTDTYDADGNLLSSTDPLGNKTTYTYNAIGQKTSMVSPRGNVAGCGCSSSFTTDYYYDGNGNLTKTTDPLGHSTQATYDGNGNVLTRTDGDSNVTTYTYNGANELVSVTDPGGNCSSVPAVKCITYTYDPNGNRISMTDADGNMTTYTYNDLNQLLQTTDPLGHSTSEAYEAGGNVASTTDADSNVTSNSYNAANELTSVSEPDTTTRTYTYSPTGQELTYSDGAGNTTTYTYNALGQLASTTDALGNTTSYTYNAAGEKATETNPDGQTTTWAYNADNKVTGISYSDGTTHSVTYTYDADGNVSTMTDASGTSTYTYDDADRLTSYENGNSKTVSYGYDSANNVTSITYPGASHTVTETYNSMNELATVTDWNSNQTQFGYDADGNLTSITYPNGVTDNRVYNAADQLNSITDKLSGTTFASFSYSRDDAGQVTSETDTGTPGAGTATSTYNSMNDLTANNGNSYSYSSAQNLTESPSGKAEQYNADDEVCWQGTGSGACSAPPSGATTYSYSNEGNRTATLPSSGTSDSYTYNMANELTGVVPSSGSFTSYVYDGSGLLQSETTGSTTTNYTWNVQSSLPLLLSDGTNYYIYGPGNNPIEQIAVSGGATSYLLADELGSIRAITNSSGTTTGTFTYDAWGNETGSTGSATSPFGFAGEYLDSASGFYYLRARWYDPVTGEFTSMDQLVAQTHQPEQYAGNNPTNHGDASGLDWGPILKLNYYQSQNTGLALAYFGDSLSRVGVPGYWANIIQNVLVGAAQQIGQGYLYCSWELVYISVALHRSLDFLYCGIVIETIFGVIPVNASVEPQLD
jgi:RHS repeat-associated protein